MLRMFAILLGMLVPSLGFAQPLDLSFNYFPGEKIQYEWAPTNFSWTFTSPGGTEVFVSPTATFNTYEEFEADIIGTWTVSSFSGDETTFEITSFDQAMFPSITLLAPTSGQTFQNGEIIATEILESTTNFDSNGTRISGSFDYEVDFLPGFAFRILLNEEIQIANLNVYRSAANFEALISSVDGALNIDTDVLVVGHTKPANICVEQDSIILGDVNGDGQVDLLDIAQFVDLITNGDFQAEADINLDGQVDLLDVAPFVDLIAG